MGSYKTRRLEYIFTQLGSDGKTILHQVNIKKHRSSFVGGIIGSGAFMMATSPSIKIWGMNESDMQRYSYTFFADQVTNSGQYRDKFKVQVYAGDDESIKTLIFDGNIISANADYSAMPEVSFDVEATSALSLIMNRPVSNSFHGEVRASDILDSLIISAGYVPINLGMKETFLRDQVLSGSIADQIRTVAKAAGGNSQVFGTSVAYWSSNALPTIDDIPILDIDTESGLIGFPQFSKNGLTVRMIMAHRIQIGRTVRIKSLVDRANGEWGIYNYRHDLTEQIPGGKWETSLALLPKASLI